LLFPQSTGASCEHEQFANGPGCLKDLKWELGGQMRVSLEREGPLSHAIDDQRTRPERINSPSKELGLKRPKVRNLDSVRHLNTLPYLVINARALRRVRKRNASLLSRPIRLVA
jgi:hypothetical protein